ncbi:hypothetical protein CQY21_26455 [Mycolicibacterium boenickei]|nr:hypothetical protein CQY21_26455 [Mycolicibacterium boenickei]
MANELRANVDGLRGAAASSDGIAADLTGIYVGSRPPTSRRSAVGVAAVNAALTEVQGRQSARVTGQADDLLVSSARYDTTDSDGHAAITTVGV